MFSDSGANLKLSVVEKTFYISDISGNNKVSL